MFNHYTLGSNTTWGLMENLKSHNPSLILSHKTLATSIFTEKDQTNLSPPTIPSFLYSWPFYQGNTT